MPQQQVHAQTGAQEKNLEQSEAVTLDHSQTQTGLDALDAVLDDIESTLQTNAEEYVASFVQKGGQ